MAVEKNSDINITYNSETVGKIGVSKTINNYTAEELWNFALCTSQWDFMQNFKNCNDVYNDVAIGINSDRENFPIYYSGSTNPSYSSAIIKYDKGVQSYNNSKGVYARVIWLQKTESGNFIRSVTNTASGYKVVTNCDWNKVLWNVQSGYEINGYDVSGDVWKGIKSPFFNLKYLVNGEYVEVSELDDIAPYIMFKIDNNICIYQVFGGLNTLYHYHLYVGRSSEIWSKSYSDILTGVEEWNGSSQISSFDGNNHYVLSLNLNSSLYSTNYYDLPYEYNIYAGVYGGGWSGCYETDIEGIGAYIDSPKENKSGGIFYAPCNPETYRMLCSLCGVIFQDDKIYKPIIKDGYVTGYTDNLTEKSDIDNYTYDYGMGHEVPDRKPVPDDEDELDDSEMTLNGNGNSFIKWFAVTGQNLLSLIDSFNSETVPAGFVPLDHIVGVYQAPFNIPDFSNCGSLANIFVGKYDTNVQGMPLLNQGSYSTTGIIASKYIEPSHNNFLDYEPYTSLSLYLPFCGSCNLDANLFVGKTVNVDYYFDIFSGDVIANVYANSSLYKTLSGNFTISQPITSQNVGLQKDTVIKGAVGIATNMLGTAGFAMSGNISGALSGAVGATISSISTYTHLNGISPVATKGGGGRSIFYTCKNIILYKSTAIENHGAYEKYKGKVCNYDSKLSECHGYTVVDNPHIEIKCTNTEKDEIKKLLEEGVILP